MSEFTIHLRDDASPILAAIEKHVRSGEIYAGMGDELYVLTRKHLFALNSRHRPGGEEFYSKAADSIGVTTNSSEIRLAIKKQGIAQRYYGGYIRPSKKQWIAIPARQEAYGHKPGEFSDLHFVFFRTGLAALVQVEGDTGRGSIDAKGEGGAVFWWLKKEVYQRPDPTVLPENTLIVQTALNKARRLLSELTS